MICYADETGLNGQNACVALGMFDGVHLGHTALLTKCVELAADAGVPSFVYTYSNSPHPQKQQRAKGLLTTTEEKLMLCENIGIQGAIVRAFTPAYRALSPEDFAALLFEDERVSTLVCGQSYRFGMHGKGDTALLEKFGRMAGRSVFCVDDLMFDGQPISSTRVRNALLQGECRLATQLLGRPYGICVSIRDQRAVWPQQKARIGAGKYVCELYGKTIPVTVQSDGIIFVHELPSKPNLYGMLSFIQKV